jgi:hypothetical protein
MDRELSAADAVELAQVTGGIWDYSNRLGLLGSILEAQKNAKYGDLLTSKTLDGAAKQALQGWVSVP